MVKTDNKEIKKKTSNKESLTNTSTFVYAELIKKIGAFSVTELNAFIKELQEHFQINPDMHIGGGTAKEATDKDEKKGLVDLFLTEIGQGKVAVIKLIAKITGKGLLDAKKMLDNLPFKVLSQKPEAEATQLQKELQDAGAVTEIK